MRFFDRFALMLMSVVGRGSSVSLPAKLMSAIGRLVLTTSVVGLRLHPWTTSPLIVTNSRAVLSWKFPARLYGRDHCP